MFTQVLAKEIGDRAITVNTVMPRPTIPGMFANIPPEVQQQAAASPPFNRLGTPQDIADIAAFLGQRRSSLAYRTAHLCQRWRENLIALSSKLGSSSTEFLVYCVRKLPNFTLQIWAGNSN